jgi:hypothetical protein
MNSSTVYPSGVAALFVQHAKEGKPIAFLSRVEVVLTDEIRTYPVRIGDFIEARAELDGTFYLVLINCREPALRMAAADVNALAGRKVVGE